MRKVSNSQVMLRCLVD